MTEPAAPAWGPPWAPGRHGWDRPFPPVARYLAAVVVALVQLGGSVGATHGQPSRRPLDALAVVLLLVAPAALVAARRVPVWSMAATAAAVAAYLLRGYAYGPVFLGLAVLLVLTVVRGRRLVAWAAAVVVLLADDAGRLLLDTSTWSWQAQGALLAWALLVLALGELARGWRERAASYRAYVAESRRRQAGEERLRIAQELHDVVAHHLSLINVQSGVALHLAHRQPENVEPALRAIKDASKEALTELRSLIDLLRADGPAPRVPTPTLAALDELVARSAQTGLRITKTVAGQQRPLPAAVELAAYRVVQEAITNVVRHASATRVDVHLAYGGGVLDIVVEDDGRGGPDVVAGNGLRGMEERAAALGGSLALRRSALGGLRVDVHLPTGEAA
jgi:signal transduction histidine kinase